jgi:quinol monooxygenase YgiN
MERAGFSPSFYRCGRHIADHYLLLQEVSVDMSKLANVVTIEVKAGRVDQVLAALLSHKERSLRDELGTLQFEVLMPRGDDSRLMTYEVYEDEAAFQAHRAAPSLAQWLAETADMVVDLRGARCAIVD